MRHEDALAAISAAADGELTDDAVLAEMEEHLADCAECREFEATVRHIRSGLRFDDLDDVPDLPMPVLPDLPPPEQEEEPASPVRGIESARSARLRSSRPMWIAAAAAAIVGMIGGAAFVGLGNEATPRAAADFADQVLAAQQDIASVDADFEVTEHVGGDDERFDGQLVYKAPESLRLTLADSDAAVSPGDVELVVHDGQWTLDSVRTCTCPESGGQQRWRQTIRDREPFSDAAPTPLELVTAVDSFALASEPIELDARTVAGHPALGVQVTAGQISGFLHGISPAGDLRAAHPTDPVDIWFERDHLVPVAVEVHAADTPERAEWARTKGYDDQPGAVVIRYEATSLKVNGSIRSGDFTPDDVDTPAEQQLTTSEGFRADDPAEVPEPARLPTGLRPHLAGTVSTPGGPTVGVRTWTDGRAWLKVRATDEWTGNRMFGDLGLATRAIDLGAAGTGYTDGHRVALHGDDLDVVVSGSIAPKRLRAVAASLGVVGRAIPDNWPEAATATLGDAEAAEHDLLAPHGLRGFAPAAIRVEDGTVTQIYTGPGERGFVLVQSPGELLAPPAGAKNVGIEVRGTSGRYSFDRTTLEWSEHGSTFGLNSSTLSLNELVDIAEGLGPP